MGRSRTLAAAIKALDPELLRQMPRPLSALVRDIRALCLHYFPGEWTFEDGWTKRTSTEGTFCIGAQPMDPQVHAVVVSADGVTHWQRTLHPEDPRAKCAVAWTMRAIRDGLKQLDTLKHDDEGLEP